VLSAARVVEVTTVVKVTEINFAVAVVLGQHVSNDANGAPMRTTDSLAALAALSF